MSFTARNSSDVTELMAFKENDKRTYHQSRAFADNDTEEDGESECQACLHHPVTDSAFSDSSDICHSDSDLKCAQRFLIGFDDSFCNHHGNNDFNSTTTFNGANPTTTLNGPNLATTLNGPNPTTTLNGPNPTTTLNGSYPTTTLNVSNPTTTPKNPNPNPTTTSNDPNPTTTFNGQIPRTTINGPNPTTTLNDPNHTITFKNHNPTATFKDRNPTANLNSNGSTGKTPFIKRLKSKPDDFSVKYSVSESKPLLSEHNHGMILKPEKIPTMASVSQQPQIKFQRSSSLDNISTSVHSTERRDTPLARMPYYSAASHAGEADSNSEDFNGSFNTYPQQSFCLKYIPHSLAQSHQVSSPHLSEQCSDPDKSLQPLIQPLNNPPYQPGCIIAHNPSQLVQHSHTSCHDSSDNTQSCGLSFAHNKNNSATGCVTALNADRALPPCSHRDTDMNNRNDHNLHWFGPGTNADLIANSTSEADLCSSPGPVNVRTHTSRSTCDDHKPLQVFVPQRHPTHCTSPTSLSVNVSTQQNASSHTSPRLDTCPMCYQQPQNSRSSVTIPHYHNVLNSTSVDESPAEEEHGNSHIIPSNGDIIWTCRSLHSTSADNGTPFSHLGLPDNEPITSREDMANYHHVTCNHNTGQVPGWRHTDPTQTQIAAYPELGSLHNQSAVTANTKPENVHDPHFPRMSEASTPQIWQLERSQNGHDGTVSTRLSQDTNSAHIIPVNLNNSQDPDRPCMLYGAAISNSNTAFSGFSNLHSSNCRAFKYTPLNPAQNTSSVVNSCNNAVSRTPYQQQHARQQDDQHLNKMEVVDNTNSGGNLQTTKDKEYKPGMIQSVPTTYFDATSMGSQSNLVGNNRDSARSSAPSSVDSERPPNREGSLQRSCTSDFDCGKAGSGVSRIALCSDRDTPDYSYLCIVATVLNPLFGLAAFLCNHYARKSYQLHKLSKANNLYFATITISTVTIFVTLVGAALLVTHSVVTNPEKQLSTFTPSVNSCESTFSYADDYLKTFFDLDFNLYCEVSKNYKIMEALKRFWLEDSQNRQKFNKVNAKNKNVTNSDTSNLGNSTKNALTNSNSFSDTKNETHSNSTNSVPNPNILKEPITLPNSVSGEFVQHPPFKDDESLHNTILSSKNGPVVPPELAGEYQLYLEGNKRTKLEDLPPILGKSASDQKQAGQQSTSSETTPTIDTTTANINPYINTKTEERRPK